RDYCRQSESRLAVGVKDHDAELRRGVRQSRCVRGYGSDKVGHEQFPWFGFLVSHQRGKFSERSLQVWARSSQCSSPAQEFVRWLDRRTGAQEQTVLLW